ncbi:MAG: hypothetical protein ABSF69_10135 [Polyangiaceae bacterium]
MRPHLLDLHRALLAWLPAGGHAIRAALRWVAHHTGLPTILVAAFALVASWRLVKWSSRLAVEVALALALLLVASHFGWFRR